MSERRRFALGYTVAWAPYAALYAAVFVAQGHTTVLHGVWDAVRNVVPAALLGLLPLRAADRLRWPARAAGRHHIRRVGAFAATHVVLAFGYSAALYTAVSLLRTAEVSARAGRLASGFLAGPALLWQALAGLMLYGTIAGVGYAVASSRRLQQEAALRTRAELAVLRAQLQPHFLFNTLHTLMALVRYEPAQAERAIERLAAMLRYTLGRGGAAGVERPLLGPAGAEADGTPLGGPPDDVALRDEWAFVEDYLALERLRLAGRLRVTADVDAGALDCRLPAITLQPLVENAVKHAIAPRPEGGAIHIAARVEDDVLRLEVRDDGPGAGTMVGTGAGTARQADPGRLTDEILAGAASRGALGLRLVRARLRARYGDRASLHVTTAPGRGFHVVVRLPTDPDDARISARSRIPMPLDEAAVLRSGNERPSATPAATRDVAGSLPVGAAP